MWVVYHKTYEPEGPLGLDAPIVVHQFYGRTKAEAIHVYQSHRASDGFLRSCDDLGHFRNIVCHVEKEIINR